MALVADCAFKGSQVPPAKYDTIKPLNLTKPKIFSLKIIGDKNRDKNPYKIVKSKDPDQGTYNPA